MRYRILALIALCVLILACLCQPALAEGVPPGRPISIKLEGTIKSITDLSEGQQLWQVAGIDVLITPETEMEPVGHVAREEDYAVIQATIEGEQIVATYVRIQTDDDALVQNDLEFRGLISAGPTGVAVRRLKQSTEWTIGGRQVELDSKAQVIGTPAVGLYAHVKGRLLRSGKVKANWVKIMDPVELAAKFELKGRIQEIASDRPGYWTIDGVRGVVSEDTEIEGTPVVGAVAEVRGSRQQRDGQLLFEHITIVQDDAAMLRLEGLIEEYGIEKEGFVVEGFIVVSGQRVYIDGMTFIDESRGRAAPGMWAEVVARLEVGGYYAQLIRVERPD